MAAVRDDLTLLRTMLRSRIVEPARLAALVGMTEAEAAAALERLTAEGLVVRTGAEALLPPPQRPTIEHAREALQGEVARLQEVIAVLDELPSRLRERQAERDGGLDMRMPMIGGPSAIVDAWWWLVEQPRPVDAFVVLPESSALLEIAEEAGGRAPSDGSVVRYLLGRDSVDAAVRETAAALRAQGAELRETDRLPGWMAGEGPERTVFPTNWGIGRPLMVRTLVDAVAAQSVRSLFDEHWRRARPLGLEPDDWEPVLRLLELGLDDATVAERLGVSERTVRRRVEDAMHALGATNRYTLGRAWAARR
ncbi:MAG: hypothetical protein J7480_08630 [Microbacteriaceae bacterium]|nr:hypothetical protein [Microbacteriaceae bacterium]